MLVTSYDYELSKRLAKRLAGVFSMRVLDQIEMFNFDHIPLSLEDVLQKNGEAYVKKELRSIVQMEDDFDNVSFVTDISFADNCEDLFYKIKLSNFVIFLYKNLDNELEELNKKQFESSAQKSLFFGNAETLRNREEKIKNDCADISINITGISDDETVELIEKLIETYYKL